MTETRETRTNHRGATVERGVVARFPRQSVVYQDPDCCADSTAVFGDSVWIEPEELAALRSSGIIEAPNKPAPCVSQVLGPALRDDEPTAGLIKAVSN